MSIRTREFERREPGTVICFLIGLFFGLALIKFANPIILQYMVESPHSFWEWVFQPWPLFWSLAPIAILMAAVAWWWSSSGAKLPKFRWPMVLPAVWLLWQFLAATDSIDPPASRTVLAHFALSVAFFYLALLCPKQHKVEFWGGMLIGVLYVLWQGLEQHYGGLAASRKQFFAVRALYPNAPPVPEAYLRKIESDRIFSTLFYPNNLAGVLLLVSPPLFVVLRMASADRPGLLRWFLPGVFLFGALSCLFWSGSRSGWIIALFIAALAFGRIEMSWRRRGILILLLLVTGGLVFGLKNQLYFKKGATSVVARKVYWKAALQTWKSNPLTGTGPGTFGEAFGKIKAPGEEPSKLVHNDYLEQGSDSGILGFVLYGATLWCFLGYLYRNSTKKSSGIDIAVSLGLLSWMLQSFVEFDLYIPALAWPFFFLCGWLAREPISDMSSQKIRGIMELAASSTPKPRIQ